MSLGCADSADEFWWCLSINRVYKRSIITLYYIILLHIIYRGLVKKTDIYWYTINPNVSYIIEYQTSKSDGDFCIFAACAVDLSKAWRDLWYLLPRSLRRDRTESTPFGYTEMGDIKIAIQLQPFWWFTYVLNVSTSHLFWLILWSISWFLGVKHWCPARTPTVGRCPEGNTVWQPGFHLDIETSNFVKFRSVWISTYLWSI